MLVSKADWRAIDSPKKRTDEFVLFAFLLLTSRQSAFRFYLTFSGVNTSLMRLMAMVMES